MGRGDGSGARVGSREASLFFFGCFLLILGACLAAVYVVQAYWGRLARRLLEERRAEEERNNPWAIRARYAGSREGSAKEGSVFGGSIVRGFMYGMYVLNPSGSFSFGSSRVETNEKEVRARREARANGDAIEGPGSGSATNGGIVVTRATGEVERASSRSNLDARGSSASDVAAEAAEEMEETEAAASDDPVVVTVVPDPWAPETTTTTTTRALAASSRDRGSMGSERTTRGGHGVGVSGGFGDADSAAP